MRTLKLTIAYDGRGFVGWQRQAGGESIQQLLEESLGVRRFACYRARRRSDGRRRSCAWTGREHQRGPSAHPTMSFVRALNAQLPDTIRVLEVVDAAPDFHARFAARSKTYRYHIRAGTTLATRSLAVFVWQLDESLDIAAMRTAAAALVGTHDFSVFSKRRTEVATRFVNHCPIQFCGGGDHHRARLTSRGNGEGRGQGLGRRSCTK